MLLLLLSLSCRTKDALVDSDVLTGDDSSTLDSAPDADGDGYGADEDCDDDDASVNPGSQELCDGIDNDCDGTADEDAMGGPGWYTDDDSDGFGAGDALEDCLQPEGTSEYAGDCDDTDPAYNPGATEDDCADPNDYNCDGSVGYDDADADGFAACEECDDSNADINPDGIEVCDGADNDCDGTIDNDDAVDAITWYADTDGDGFGDLDATVVSCDAPTGYVADGTDCDDNDGAINPDADEVCDDADNDCDGTIDNDDDIDAATWWPDADSDGFGSTKGDLTSCDQPSGYVSDNTDCDDAEAAVNPDEDEICNSVDDDCDGTIDNNDAIDAPTWYDDDDSDGYGDPDYGATACSQPSGTVSDSTDCDDSESTTNPGADEYCDGHDDDCDGTIDEDDAVDAATWYDDGDTDGYGDASDSTVACDQPSGYVSDATDCDDAESTTNPGADEYCDGHDDDCDTQVDEGSALDALTWYADDDTDGYGDSADTTTACDQPSGYVSDATDCDDTEGTTNPGADEYCDGHDDDCDGTTDEDDAVDVLTWYVDADSDGYGDSATTDTDCYQPSGYAAVDGDCDEGDSGVNPGATEICNAVDEDCNGSVDDGSVCPCAVEYNGSSTYMFCNLARNWNTADAYCDTYGYDLLTIDNATENAWADSTADTYSTGKWWVGLNDISSEGTWVWDDGTAVSYTNWHSGEPNNSGGNEDCVQLNRFTDQSWNDEPCGSAFRFVCEVN
jgi:large repetitive protein